VSSTTLAPWRAATASAGASRWYIAIGSPAPLAFGRLIARLDSAVGVVVEPRPDDERPELRLRLESERRGQRVPRVGLEADVLSGTSSSRCRVIPDAMPCRRYADAVQTSTRYALHTPSERRRAIPTSRSPSPAKTTCRDCSKERR